MSPATPKSKNHLQSLMHRANTVQWGIDSLSGELGALLLRLGDLHTEMESIRAELLEFPILFEVQAKPAEGDG